MYAGGFYTRERFVATSNNEAIPRTSVPHSSERYRPNRWPFSFRWRMCHPCSTSRTGRALDDPHYLPGLHRESISQGVISCQWRLDPAGNTGGGLHSLVPRSVGNSDITPNLVERLLQSRCHLHGSYRWWPSSSGRQASIVLVESSTGEATLPIQVPSSGPSRAIALPASAFRNSSHSSCRHRC